MGGAGLPRPDRLNCIGIALQSLVRTDDTFVREAQQDYTAVVGWNLRRSEFLSTVWKMKSKINDLIIELTSQMSKISQLFNLAKAMKIDSDVRVVPWSVVYFEMKRKAAAYDEIRSLIKDSRLQMDRLCLYKNQVKRLANKVHAEEEGYKAHTVTSLRIRDGELDENTTRNYILTAREVCLAACELILEHKELILEFQQSSLQFRESCLENYEFHYNRAIENNKNAKKEKCDASRKTSPDSPTESAQRPNKRTHALEPEEVPEKKMKEN